MMHTRIAKIAEVNALYGTSRFDLVDVLIETTGREIDAVEAYNVNAGTYSALYARLNAEQRVWDNRRYLPIRDRAVRY